MPYWQKGAEQGSCDHARYGREFQGHLHALESQEPRRLGSAKGTTSAAEVPKKTFIPGTDVVKAPTAAVDSSSPSGAHVFAATASEPTPFDVPDIVKELLKAKHKARKGAPPVEPACLGDKKASEDRKKSATPGLSDDDGELETAQPPASITGVVEAPSTAADSMAISGAQNCAANSSEPSPFDVPDIVKELIKAKEKARQSAPPNSSTAHELSDIDDDDLDRLSDVSDNSDLFHVAAVESTEPRTDEDSDVRVCRSIVPHLRDFPLLPLDGRDHEKTKSFRDVQSGVLLPLLNYGFKGCSWHHSFAQTTHLGF